ncbi:uncharacterized protein LOC114933365 [Nylanderia fulva]|uniref:uncharacterized protein LOC114933365 n=1 Tax=Nylanderia fulva TaxID=613905 RepID=UPI0010FB535A|nr:uncharacterized protein LOC114933365 [Nylanderia fulva]
MPNENLPVCACGVDLSKSRNSSIVLEKLTTLLPKSKGNKQEDKGSRRQQDDRRGLKTRTSSETGSSSSVTEPAKSIMKSSKYEKRINHSRRTRSADSAESHYTYIDSGSSILGDGIRENTVRPEVLYTSVPNTANVHVDEIRTSRSNNMQNRSQAFYYAIPSMTSPPPTYDVAIAKAWQTGLPPTYEEYLYHKYAIMSRSHTPPPPWSDSTSSTLLSSNPTSNIQTHRNRLPSQSELREYLEQLTLGSHNQHQQYQHQLQQRQSRDATCPTLREQQIRAQHRARAMAPRSQSESRAQQQRMAAMYEDAAFCMETTVLQSAFDAGQGLALCSLM